MVYQTLGCRLVIESNPIHWRNVWIGELFKESEEGDVMVKVSDNMGVSSKNRIRSYFHPESLVNLVLIKGS